MAERFCSISECGRKPIAKGLCHKHYMQARRESIKAGTFEPKVRPTCLVDGCDGLHVGHGYCNKHYFRFQKGTLDEVENRVGPVTMEWLEENSELVTERGCRIWTRSVDTNGYGLLRDDGPLVRAHRKALELHLGRALRDGMFACHHCDTPPCINPAHLYEGTPQENALDVVRRERNRVHRMKRTQAG